MQQNQIQQNGSIKIMVKLCNMSFLEIGKYAFKLLADYRAQKKRGIKSPTFKKSLFPKIKNDIDAWE